ncbi:MAG: hypothetical protein HWQ35_15285 [Nostoc sp. NMS1]|uniref:hypothetical protein n=1 Tax=Nostoc sp. NMS1 TaxID=2815388 RepID=UPI0025E609D0|nr:hypothetical protein [Nostoc sp. NMS1]MBN3907866.1 hypothetical protein [Nostoc sp. NMS1]
MFGSDEKGFSMIARQRNKATESATTAATEDDVSNISHSPHNHGSMVFRISKLLPTVRTLAVVFVWLPLGAVSFSSARAAQGQVWSSITPTPSGQPEHLSPYITQGEPLRSQLGSPLKEMKQITKYIDELERNDGVLYAHLYSTCAAPFGKDVCYETLSNVAEKLPKLTTNTKEDAIAQIRAIRSQLENELKSLTESPQKVPEANMLTSFINWSEWQEKVISTDGVTAISNSLNNNLAADTSRAIKPVLDYRKTANGLDPTLEGELMDLLHENTRITSMISSNQSNVLPLTSNISERRLLPIDIATHSTNRIKDSEATIQRLEGLYEKSKGPLEHWDYARQIQLVGEDILKKVKFARI